MNTRPEYSIGRKCSDKVVHIALQYCYNTVVAILYCVSSLSNQHNSLPYLSSIVYSTFACVLCGYIYSVLTTNSTFPIGCQADKNIL